MGLFDTKVTLQTIKNDIFFADRIDEISDEYLSFLKLSKDEITTKVYQAIMLPFIDKFSGKNIPNEIKSVIAKLVEILLIEAPESYLKNIQNILNLKLDDSDKLLYIEENYGIIKAISEKEKYIKRIDILNWFSELVNGKKSGSVKERTTLHHIVDKNLWIFGEEFEEKTTKDISSDVSLRTILEKQGVYSFDSDELDKIVKEHDLKKIPDIFIPIEENNLIYIIELKKPTVKISSKIMNEVMNKYVKTLNEINKKYNTENKKRIKAIAVSTDKTEHVYTLGKLDRDGFEIEAKTWDEIIETTRKRYKEKIDILDYRLKQSKWKNLEDFILKNSAVK